MQATLSLVRIPLAAALIVGLATSLRAAATDPIPADMNWPAWRGNGYGVATKERPQQLVNNLGDAKMVWKSEAAFSVPSSSKGMKVLCGYGNFILFENKLYIPHYRGCGDVLKAGMSIQQLIKLIEVDFNNPEKMTGELELWGSLENWARRKGAALADDVLTCIDASTGKTLWEATMSQKGVNYNYCDGMTSPPCTDGECVFFIGTAGRLYAVDVDDGKLVWETELPLMKPDKLQAAVLSKAKELKSKYSAMNFTSLKKGQLKGIMHEAMWPNAESVIVTKPRVIDGVLVVGEKGLCGFNPADGSLLWGPIGKVQEGNPMPWIHQGKGYAISALHYRRRTAPGLICVDVQSGEVVWLTREIAIGISAPLIVDDVLVSNGSQLWGGWGKKATKALRDGERVPQMPRAYRLTLQGPELMWEYPKGTRGRVQTIAPVYYKGHVYLKAPGCGTGAHSGGDVACVDLLTGKVKHRMWTYITDHDPGSPWNELQAANNRLFHGRSKPQFMALIDDPENIVDSPRDGKLGPAMLVNPVIVDGRVFYRGSKHYHCLDLRVGK